MENLEKGDNVEALNAEARDQLQKLEQENAQRQLMLQSLQQENNTLEQQLHEKKNMNIRKRQEYESLRTQVQVLANNMGQEQEEERHVKQKLLALLQQDDQWASQNQSAWGGPQQ